MPSSTFTLYDPRTEDTYVVSYDIRTFLHALRYIAQVNCDPIVYEHLADVPQPLRDQIADRLAQ